MPTLGTSHLPEPTDWNEFEDICADLFGLEWGDPNVTRYGRQGERQDGVDIYGTLNGKSAGVQCKGRRYWPLRELKTADIDAAVVEAKQFKPALATFIIATTAPVGRIHQDHARTISSGHEAQGLFNVHVVGWNELYRRLTKYDNLVRKHFGVFTLSDVHEAITEGNQRAADLVLGLRETFTALASSDGQKISTNEAANFEALQGSITEAVERDFASRYALAVRRSLFPEAIKSDSFQALARELLDTQHTKVSAPLRRRILFRAARSSALRGELDEAQRFLSAGVALQGEDSDAPARARLAEARGELDAAIQLLRDQNDVDSRSTLFTILTHHRGDDAGLAFLNEQSIAVADLTVNGVHALCHLHLKRNDIEKVQTILNSVSATQLTESPYLLFLRGAVRLAALVPKPDQALVLRGLPQDVRFARMVPPKATVAIALDAAITDLNQIIFLAPELQLRETKRIAEAYTLWCELLHPDRHDAALDRLRRDMKEPRLALQRLQFAFAFDPDFDLAPVTMYLEKREQLGGFDGEEIAAALILRLHGNDPRALADFISKQRTALETSFGAAGIAVIEIQALAKAQDATSARILYQQHRQEFDDTFAVLLEAEIAKADGSDPVAESKRVYEETKSVDALRVLIGQLLEREDHRALGYYAEMLYQRTGDPMDAVLAAKAFASAGDDEAFLRAIDLCPPERRDPSLMHRHAWVLFQRGLLKDAAQVVDELRKTPQRDLNLEIAIAIECGDWEALAVPLNEYLVGAANYGGLALIRAAHLAQASAQGPLIPLMEAAVKYGGDDPNVLVGAYSLVLEEGLEDKKPEAAGWFRHALDVSGDDGPVKAFELKDLLAQQLEWNEHTRRITDAVVKGDLPLGFAATALRTTFVDVVLGGLIRNSIADDPRRRVALPLFTGQRDPSVFGEVSRVLLDVSTLMVTGWLGILQKTIDSYAEIVVPGGALQELFEGCARIRQFQKSQIDNARQIQAAIARGQIKVLPPDSTRDLPGIEIGSELATLLTAAERAKGVVVRAPPVKRLDGTYETEVDMTAHAAHLTDMHALLDGLVEAGAVDEATESMARGYFNVQDKRWPSPAAVKPHTPIFVDWLTLTQLQTVGLFELFLRTFHDVHVADELKEESASLVDFEQHTTAILSAIDAIRTVVHRAYKSGKLLFGPHRKPSRSETEDDAQRSSTLNLAADLLKADMVIIDDRSLNKQFFAVDSHGHRAPLGTSLDLIEDLTARGKISSAERRTLRHRLRSGGAVLVPLQAEEVVVAALRSGQSESAEFRAIRENIGLARIAEVPRFPAEMRWFVAATMAIQHAVIQLWNREPDHAKAARLADSVLDLRPEPEDWIACWEGAPPPEWCSAVHRVMTASLCLPFEIEAPEATDAYNDWLESRVLGPLRVKAPRTYDAIVEQIRGVILNDPENAHGD
jgi:hypothetical protein